MDKVRRIRVLKVPVDVIHPEHMEEVIFDLVAEAGTKQIVFLDIWRLLKARNNPEFLTCLENASLVLPISKSIISGAKFLGLPIPIRYNPFSGVVQILTILESRYKSLYLLGSRKGCLMTAERNVRATLPNLHIVGRYVGYYPKEVEKDVVEAIFKANPTLVLLSDGIRDDIMWSYKRRNSFGSSIFLYYKDAFGIFSKRIKRVSSETFNKGKEIWVEIFHNPLKIFLVFPFIWYILTLVWYRLFKKLQ